MTLKDSMFGGIAILIRLIGSDIGSFEAFSSTHIILYNFKDHSFGCHWQPFTNTKKNFK